MKWILHPNHTAQWENQSLINALSESSWMTDFTEALSDSTIAHPISFFVRDANTSKYLLANTGEARLYGLESPDELIGLSFYDLWIEDVHHRKEKLRLNNTVLHWEEEELKRAEQREDQIRSTKLPLNINRACPTHNHFYSMGESEKITRFR